MILLDDVLWTNPLFLAILGIITTVVIGIPVYLKKPPRKEISYQVVSDAPIANVDRRVEDKVKLIYEDKGSGNEINDARLLILKVWNSGSSEIKVWKVGDEKVEDFNKPIVFKFEGREVVNITGVETDPHNDVIEPEDLETYKKTLQLEPDSIGLPHCSLKPKQSISLSVLLKGSKGRIVAKGKLFQGSIVNLDEIRQKKLERRRFLLNGMGSVGLVLLGVFIAAILFYFIYSFIAHRIIRFDFSVTTYQQETFYGGSVHGLPPNTTYYVTYDQGMCGGPPLQFITRGRPRNPDISTDENGNATFGFSTSEVVVTSKGLFQPIFVDIRQEFSGSTVACTQIQVNT